MSTKEDREKEALARAGIVPIAFDSRGLFCAGSDDPEALEPLCMRCRRFRSGPTTQALMQPPARYVEALREWRCVEFHEVHRAPLVGAGVSLALGGVAAYSALVGVPA